MRAPSTDAAARRCARPRHRRALAQTMALVALVLPLLLSVSMLAVQVGLDFADRRAAQSGADAGAMSGAEVLSKGTATTLRTAQQYAWRDLNQSVPAAASSCQTSPCVVSDGVYPAAGGYRVTVTAPYTTRNPAYASSSAVAVDVVHVKVQTPIAAMFGFSTATVSAHAAATASSGTSGYPFALATRLLDLTGNGAVTTFGADIVAECSGDGAGTVTDHGVNGGIYFGGANSALDLAGVADYPSPSAPPPYSSAQAVLLATPTGSACTGAANADASSGWQSFGGKVSFDTSNTKYNGAYGFDAGPAGCASGTASACAQTSTGDGSWEDPCWTSGSKVVAVNSASGVYNAAYSTAPTLGTVTGCASLAESHEGSFGYSSWPGLPAYASPADLAAGEGLVLTASGTHAMSGTSITGDQYFNSVSASGGANLVFGDGWYVFDGSGASVSIGNGGSMTCSGVAGSSHIPGCVFIFENGASLNIQSATLRCNGSVSGQGNCAFQFSTTTTGGSVGSLAFTNGDAISLHPIVSTQGSTSEPAPLIYSQNNANCLNTSAACAVTMAQSGSTFDVLGTIVAPHGVAFFNANAQPVSGQILADTIRLQAGSSALGSGVAYNGAFVAPELSLPTLVE